MAAVVKSGTLKRHTKNWRSKGWVDVWVVLKQDSSLLIYKKCGQPQPTWTVSMKEVCQCFTFGQYTDSMPNRPELPPGGQKGNLLAIPEKPRRETKIHWFLPETETHLHEWMGAIVSTLPPAPGSEAPPPYSSNSAPIGFEGHQQQHHQHHQHHQQQQQQPQVNVQVIHPQQYPQQQALYPQQQYTQAPAYPQQQYAQPAAYPQQHTVHYAQQPGQVVVVDGHRRSRNNDMAAFMGGAALGMMMGGRGYYGYGFRRWGSWSSFGSYGSFGSCGSFGSFG